MNAADRVALFDRFRVGGAAVQAALAGITEEELNRRPPAGGWSAREVVHHLADREATAYVRLRRLVAEDEPLIQAYDEPEYARRLHYGRPIAALHAVRDASLELLESLTPVEWERSGTHSESGPYSVETWLRIYADHCHDHADQTRDARGQAAG